MTPSDRWSDADRELVAQAICDNNPPEAWAANPQLVPAHHYAAAVLDALTAAGWQPPTPPAPPARFVAEQGWQPPTPPAPQVLIAHQRAVLPAHDARVGTEVLLVFHATDDRRVFVARRADTEEPVQAEVGDRMKVDALAAGQSVVLDGGTS